MIWLITGIVSELSKGWNLITEWHCLSDELREPLLTATSFRQLLYTRLFAEY